MFVSTKVKSIILFLIFLLVEITKTANDITNINPKKYILFIFVVNIQDKIKNKTKLKSAVLSPEIRTKNEDIKKIKIIIRSCLKLSLRR